MKNLFFDTNHIDLIGGGGLALYNLSVALQEFYDVHLAEPWNSEMGQYEFLREPSRPFKIGRPSVIDIYVASKYAVYSPPQGEKNVFYCLYPQYDWNMAGYDRILTLSDYSKMAIARRWKKDSEIVIGGAFSADYAPEAPKENSILSCSRFFMEGNPETFEGHSKNQHLLIAAFRTLPKDLPWTLTLAGSVLGQGDERYLEACQRLAAGDPRIRFVRMPKKEELKHLYAKAKIYVHAMGYGRSNPAETEHYGICVEKGLLSGCHTLVHESGGAPEMSYQVWGESSELPSQLLRMIEASINLDHEGIALQSRRTWGDFLKKVGIAFRGI